MVKVGMADLSSRRLVRLTDRRLTLDVLVTNRDGIHFRNPSIAYVKRKGERPMIKTRHVHYVCENGVQPALPLPELEEHGGGVKIDLSGTAARLRQEQHLTWWM